MRFFPHQQLQQSKKCPQPNAKLLLGTRPRLCDPQLVPQLPGSRVRSWRPDFCGLDFARLRPPTALLDRDAGLLDDLCRFHGSLHIGQLPGGCRLLCAAHYRWLPVRLSARVAHSDSRRQSGHSGRPRLDSEHSSPHPCAKISSVGTKDYHVATMLGLLPAQTINVYLGSTLRSMHEVLNDNETKLTGYISFVLEVICGVVLMFWVVQKARKELSETLISVDYNSDGKHTDIEV
ncbi:transmembrane protein 64 isoform X2 [Drosophila kikkawai]|uniref:Transmembrane protein 64 isoform X2 n=1 Tax=Drosophila kikkawai TaxID=30033 RepID=A0ABM4GEF3_DROKI